MNNKKINNLISTGMTVLLLIIVLFLAFTVIMSKASGGEPNVFGYQLKTVLSGSMEPGIKTGSIIAVKPLEDATNLEVGDVITFQESQEKVVTHRITEVIKSGDQVMYRTKGDNNENEDMNPVLSENVLAIYTDFTIPYIGYFNEFAKSKNGSLVLMVLPGVLIFAYSIFTLWKTIARIEKNITATKSEIEDTKSVS